MLNKNIPHAMKHGGFVVSITLLYLRVLYNLTIKNGKIKYNVNLFLGSDNIEV